MAKQGRAGRGDVVEEQGRGVDGKNDVIGVFDDGLEAFLAFLEIDVRLAQLGESARQARDEHANGENEGDAQEGEGDGRGDPRTAGVEVDVGPSVKIRVEQEGEEKQDAGLEQGEKQSRLHAENGRGQDSGREQENAAAAQGPDGENGAGPGDEKQPHADPGPHGEGNAAGEGEQHGGEVARGIERQIQQQSVMDGLEQAAEQNGKG